MTDSLRLDYIHMLIVGLMMLMVSLSVQEARKRERLRRSKQAAWWLDVETVEMPEKPKREMKPDPAAIDREWARRMREETGDELYTPRFVYLREVLDDIEGIPSEKPKRKPKIGDDGELI